MTECEYMVAISLNTDRMSANVVVTLSAMDLA